MSVLGSIDRIIYICIDEGENGYGEEKREWRLPGLLYAEDLLLCDESEEDLRVMERCFVEVCRRRSLKVNAGKNKVMVLSGEEGYSWDMFKAYLGI